VSNGAFSKTVKLREGVNVIDVNASMRGRSPAFAALRVTYDPRVTIPDLEHLVDDEAADRIDKLGLEPELEAVGGLFDELRSGPRRVCETDPPAGTTVDPGSTVTLKTAKRC
jgi:beta-lactam-binding protein with PASTA domain